MTQVTVRLFARYEELLGFETLELSLDDPATVEHVIERLRELPGGGALPATVLAAVNLKQAALDTPVAAGDEVALLPPLAGG